VPRDLTTLPPPRPPLGNPPHEAEAASARRTSDNQKVDAQKPADRLPLSAQCCPLLLAQDLCWGGFANAAASAHLDRNKSTRFIAREDIDLEPINAQIACQDLPACARQCSRRLPLCCCADGRAITYHWERLNLGA
jgi:hypothetical protein